MEDWPPESPDLNPIEPLWQAMKLAVEKRGPKTAADLERYCADFWQQTVTVEFCRKYILHLQKQMVKVVEAQGAPVN